MCEYLRQKNRTRHPKSRPIPSWSFPLPPISRQCLAWLLWWSLFDFLYSIAIYIRSSIQANFTLPIFEPYINRIIQDMFFLYLAAFICRCVCEIHSCGKLWSVHFHYCIVFLRRTLPYSPYSFYCCWIVGLFPVWTVVSSDLWTFSCP